MALDRIKGSDVRKGMLLKDANGDRYIVESVRDSMWHYRRARKDWLPDLRHMGMSAWMDPESHWECHGWRTDNQPLT